MPTNEKIVKKLDSQVNKLKNKIEHRKLYNVRNLAIRTLIRTGFVIDYVAPFVLAGFIGANNPLFKENPPFQIDKFPKKASVQTIDTSSGIHTEKITYDFRFNDEILEHSTGWVINDKGLYERIVTTYKVSEKIDLEDTDSIFKMSKEEIESSISVTNIKKISKSILSDDDYIYNEDAIIVINHKKIDKYTTMKDESTIGNILNTMFYLFYIYGSATIINRLKRIIFKMNVSEKIKSYELTFVKYSKNDLKEMRKILKLREENLTLVATEYEGFQYKLRKDIKG